MKNLRIYGTSLSYAIDGKTIVLQALKPYQKSRGSRSLYNILLNIAEVDKLNLLEFSVLYKNRAGNWGQLVVGNFETKFISSRQTDYFLAKQKIENL